MWAATSVATFEALISQHTFVPVILTSAVPLPSGSPFGVSAFPVSVAWSEPPPFSIDAAAPATGRDATITPTAKYLNLIWVLSSLVERSFADAFVSDCLSRRPAAPGDGL